MRLIGVHFENKLKNILNNTPNSSWEDVCERNMIRRVSEKESIKWDMADLLNGVIFEEFVLVPDPMGGSRFLEMSREVAMKILTLGMLR